MIAAELGLTHNQARAHLRLSDAINDAQNAGCIVPCVLDPGGWEPDGSPEKARTAINWCLTCPVLEECRAFAETHPLAGTYRAAAVIGGQWWSGSHTVNPYPARKHREPRPCTECSQNHRDRHRLCRPCRYQRQKTKENAA